MTRATRILQSTRSEVVVRVRLTPSSHHHHHYSALALVLLLHCTHYEEFQGEEKPFNDFH
jgi:hypothetical protein